MAKLPLDSAAGRKQYQRCLQARSPHAFAVAKGRLQWDWVAGGGSNAAEQALKRCEERAQQACVLYSVDDNVF